MKTTASAIPPIPTTMFSVFGDMSVTLEPTLMEREKAMGKVEYTSRKVTIQADMHALTAWQAYFHEAVHLALWDSGTHTTLSSKQEESVCDSLGTYLAAMIAGGVIRFTQQETGGRNKPLRPVLSTSTAKWVGRGRLPSKMVR